MEERWSRRANRIEPGDSPVFSIPVRARRARCFLARVALFPVVGDSICRLAEPLLVVPELLQDFGGEELAAVPRGMAEALIDRLQRGS